MTFHRMVWCHSSEDGDQGGAVKHYGEAAGVTIQKIAISAIADGVQSCEIVPGGELHQWIHSHCRSLPSQEWLLLFTVACEMGRNFRIMQKSME